MTKDNVVIGAKLTLDVEDKKVFISMDDEVHIIEGDVKSSKITFNVPRGVDYTALFTGKVELTLEDYPCYLIEESKVKDLVDSMLPKPEELNKQQIPLFNQTNSEESEVAKNRGKTSTFEESAYEAHRAVGTKYRPDASLSKKQQKKFHTARRAYEGHKGYESMYPSEKKGEEPAKTVDKPVQQTTQETAQQSTKESTEQVQEESIPTAEEIALAKAYGVEPEDVKVKKPDVKVETEHKKVEPTDMGKGAESVRDKTEEKKINIAKEMETKGEPQSLEEQHNQEVLKREFDLGKGNEIGTFGQVWDGFCIAYYHKVDTTYTITATKVHPIDGFKYYLAFPTDRGAKYVRDLMMKHGDIIEQVKDSKIYQISEILTDEFKETPCVIVQEGLSYLSGTAFEKVQTA